MAAAALAAVLGALGGAQGLVALITALSNTLFALWKLANQILGKENIPSWEELMNKNRLEAEAQKADKNEIQVLIDRLESELDK